MYNDDWLIYEVLSGSRAYGLNTKESDYDYRGVCIPDRSIINSPFKNFEQYEDKKNDRVIFGLKKFIKLAAACNPNVVEILFIKEDKIKFENNRGELLRDNRDLFLSAKAKFTYTGYAFSQLNRIKRHKKWFDNPIEKPDRKDFGLKEKNKIFDNNMLKQLSDNFRNFLMRQLIDETYNKFKIDKTLLSDNFSNILLDLPRNFFQDFAIKFFAHLSKELIKEKYVDILIKELIYYEKYKEWKGYIQWKENRNPERAKLERKYGYDIKHGTHLLRLLFQGKEILTTGTLTVDVSNIKEIVNCKQGRISYEQLIKLAEKLNDEIDTIYKNKKCIIPNKPNIKKIEKLYLEILNSI